MRRPIALSMATALVLALLGACSDGSGGIRDVLSQQTTTPGSAAPGVGICGLLTTDEVATALGKPMADGEEEMEGVIPTCTWTSTLPPTNDSLDNSVSVTVAILPLTADDQATFDTLVADTEHTIVLDGMGDMAIAQCAFSSTDGCPWHDKVFVLKGDHYLMVDLSNFSAPGDFDQEQIVEVITAVARVAAPRI